MEDYIEKPWMSNYMDLLGSEGGVNEIELT
jgi:hypothetical protein